MPRPSKIDTRGLGPKIIAYAQSGVSQEDILKRIAIEHPDASLTPNNLSVYLAKHIKNRDNMPPHPTDIREITVQTFREALRGAINEAMAKYDEYRDDPKAGWAWFKHYLDTLDRMGKAAGAFASDGPTVNVQVNNIVSKDVFEKSLKDAEEYFESLEHVGGEHAV
jgi:hypothetical protein